MLTRTQITSFAASLLVTAALAVVPATSVGAADPKLAAGSQACAALTSDLTGGLTSVTGALGAVPPDLSKVTGLVGTLVKTAQSLTSLGCLPDPISAVPAVPLRSEQLLPGVPGLPGAPAVPPCAAPAADLLSKLFGLVANLLKALGAALPDVVGLLGQVTGLQTTVTGLTGSVGGAPSCLPLPVKQ
jgi:hypothetical protein